MEKYVVISSDDNPLYKDFYEIVANQWLNYGYKTYFFNITDENDIIYNDYGVVHKIKKIDKYPLSFQTQIIRLFSCNVVDADILISDIDMLPLNREYFDYYFNKLELNQDKIFLPSGQPYSDVPFFPMCYVFANSKTLSKNLSIDNMDFETFCHFVIEKVGIKWNSDEHFLYLQLINADNLIKDSRVFNNRVDRSNWKYDDNLLINGFYIDSHLLRPLEKYKNEITTLINKINNEPN